MQAIKSTLSDRQAVWAFVLGGIAVTVGVCAHLPMFAMARSMHYRLVGMPMGGSMVIGMALIVFGTKASCSCRSGNCSDAIVG